MKILLIQNRFYPAIGGGELHTYLLAKYLSARGHDVTIYTTSSLTKSDIPSLSLKPPFFQHAVNKSTLPSEEKIEGATVKRFDMKLRFWSYNWVPDLSRELKRTIGEFDVVHVHGYHISTSIMGCRQARTHGKPLILTAHDLILPSNISFEAKVFKKIYDATFGRYLLSNATKLIGLTEDHIPQYNARGGNRDKIVVVPNGIELAKYSQATTDTVPLKKYPIGNNDHVLLFVGRLEKYKGVQDILQILPGIIKKIPNVKLVVVGKDYGYEKALRGLVTEKRLEDNVIFTGGVPEYELIQLFKRADLFVFPSQMEGFGIVILEAMATNTLCIAYPIPAIRRLISNENNGILVDNTEQMQERILYYLSHPADMKRITTQAAEFVKNYDIERIVGIVEKTYLEAINEN